VRWLPARGGPLALLFFSSRRRHTRFKCDWSSDVCSSDLIHLPLQGLDYWSRVAWHHARGEFHRFGYFSGKELSPEPPLLLLVDKIGRASCRERGWRSGIGRVGKEKRTQTRVDTGVGSDTR